MPRTAAASATIIPFPKAARRSLTFSSRERQALLGLTYTVPGTGIHIAADEAGEEYASLGAHDFEDGAWWTVFITPDGFEVINFTGLRVACFGNIESLVERMGPHMAYMLNRTIPGDDTPAAGSQPAASRSLTIV